MTILGLLLLLGVTGLIWEYTVVLPGFHKAQEALDEMAMENIKLKVKDSKTKADVEKLLDGKQPYASNVILPERKSDNPDPVGGSFLLQDKYLWRHALPWKKPESITVTYKRMMKDESELKQDAKEFAASDWKFSRIYVNQDPPDPTKFKRPENVNKDFPRVPKVLGSPGNPGTGDNKEKGKKGDPKKRPDHEDTDKTKKPTGTEKDPKSKDKPKTNEDPKSKIDPKPNEDPKANKDPKDTSKTNEKPKTNEKKPIDDLNKQGKADGDSKPKEAPSKSDPKSNDGGSSESKSKPESSKPKSVDSK